MTLVLTHLYLSHSPVVSIATVVFAFYCFMNTNKVLTATAEQEFVNLMIYCKFSTVNSGLVAAASITILHE